MRIVRSVLATIFLVGAFGPSATLDKDRALADVPSSVTSISANDLDLRLSVVDRNLFDLAKLQPGKDFVSSSQAHVHVRGWSCEPKRNAWECAGPATNQAHFTFRGESPIDRAARVGLELEYDGRSLGKRELPVLDVERIEVLKDAGSALSFPSDVRAGSLFVVTRKPPVIDAGSWSLDVGGVSVPPVDPLTIVDDVRLGGPILKDRVFFRLPDDVRDGSEVRFRYRDPFGDTLVDAPPPGFFFGGPRTEPCKPTLTTCQEMTVVGSDVCICGCFPEWTWLDLTLDGKPIGVPIVASSTMIRVPLHDVEPGRHVIAHPATGQAANFEVVKARGSISQNRLKVGGSAILTFGLDGTRRVLPMEIELTEGNVLVSGGNRQIAWTTGGDNNHFHRYLHATGVGDFGIDYKFKADPCPCTREPQIRLVDDDFATHPLSAEGRFDSTFRTGGEGRFPLTFRSDSIVTRAPRPPLPAGEDIEIEFVQLGLVGSTPGFGEIRFEERIDARSVGRLRQVELDDAGGFRAGEMDLELYADFSTAFDKKLPFKVGGSYTLGLEGFEMRGTSPGLGTLTFSQRPGADSTATFEDIRKDAAGEYLFGKAKFQVYGTARF